MVLPANSALAITTLNQQQREEEERIRLKKLVLAYHSSEQKEAEKSNLDSIPYFTRR